MQFPPIRQPRDLDHGPDFDSTPARGGNASSYALGFLHVFGVDHKEAAKLLARLRERTVCYQALTVADADAGGCRCGMQRSRSDIVAVRFRLICAHHRKSTIGISCGLALLFIMQ